MEKLKCKVVMLPTEKAGSVFGKVTKYLGSDTPTILRYWAVGSGFSVTNQNIYPQHLYLISIPTEEQKKLGIGVIKEGDWIYICGKIAKASVQNCSKQYFPKIEATTDPSLNLSLIPQSFVEKYVEEQGNIDEVMIEMEYDSSLGEDTPFYPFVKLRKDNTVIVSKVKDTWTREEVMDIVYQFASTKAFHLTKEELCKYTTTKKWIEENL